ncbi:MAG: hypothetical protein Pg6C_13210 [Treponemataceae bacterium]|nr:MAG: hypothetical protein Pg6C_13210 [Treponemataceae bacterium]
MGFFETAGAFLDGFFGTDSQESLGDWVERYSDSQNVAGVYLFLRHGQSSDVCEIEGSIVGYDEKEIDRYLAIGIPYDKRVQELFKDGKVSGNSGSKAKGIWIPFGVIDSQKGADFDDFDDFTDAVGENDDTADDLDDGDDEFYDDDDDFEKELDDDYENDNYDFEDADLDEDEEEFYS